TRHVWDGLRSQRLDRPYIRVNGKLRPASWDEAFAAVAKAIKASGMGNKVGAIAGDLASVEDMYALKALMTAMGSGMTDVRPPMSGIDPSMPRSAYLFNPTIAGIEEADAILVVGSNPRKEAPVLNARIRKAWRARGTAIAVIGDHADLTYPYDYLGNDIADLAKVAAGEGFGEKLKAAKKPLVIVGEGAVSHGAAWSKQIGRDVIALASKAATLGDIADGWNGYALLHNAASRVGGIDIGFVPHAGGVCSADQVKAAGEGKLDVLFLLGADEYDTRAMGNAFVIYIGTHGDAGAHRADVILPAAAYTEKAGTYVNTEGRVQVTERAVFPPGDVRRIPASGADRPDRAGGPRRDPRPRGPRHQDQLGKARFAGRRLLHDQPHRPRLGDHGRVLADAVRSQAGGGVSACSSSPPQRTISSAFRSSAGAIRWASSTRACCSSSRCWSSRPISCSPTARSGRPCRCGAAPTWSARSACSSRSPICSSSCSRNRTSRPPRTRSCSCSRRS